MCEKCPPEALHPDTEEQALEDYELKIHKEAKALYENWEHNLEFVCQFKDVLNLARTAFIKIYRRYDPKHEPFARFPWLVSEYLYNDTQNMLRSNCRDRGARYMSEATTKTYNEDGNAVYSTPEVVGSINHLDISPERANCLLHMCIDNLNLTVQNRLILKCKYIDKIDSQKKIAQTVGLSEAQVSKIINDFDKIIKVMFLDLYHKGECR